LLIEKSNYVNDPDAPITPYEFVSLAFEATGKVGELGWKV